MSERESRWSESESGSELRVLAHPTLYMNFFNKAFFYLLKYCNLDSLVLNSSRQSMLSVFVRKVAILEKNE